MPEKLFEDAAEVKSHDFPQHARRESKREGEHHPPDREFPDKNGNCEGVRYYSARPHKIWGEVSGFG